MSIVIVVAVIVLVGLALFGKSNQQLEEELRKERAYFEEFRNKF